MSTRHCSTSAAHSQDEVIAFLSVGESYGLPGARVERIETHISIVFLVGDRAYKLKRAVRFSYLDYSKTSNRERFCKSELELNRRTAIPFTFACALSIGARTAAFASTTAQ